MHGRIMRPRKVKNVCGGTVAQDMCLPT